MTNSLKRRIINGIIAREGGYVNDPSDSGGETNWGVTESVARAAGYAGPMRSMSRRVAFEIYAGRYWDSVRADDMQTISDGLAEELVDTAVNMGPGRAGEFLQRALNVLNNGQRLYADLKVDGAIGPMTFTAVKQYAAARDVETLVKALNCLQGAAYIELAERREKDERFVYGWLKHRVAI